jgi:virginiamycin B lyase
MKQGTPTRMWRRWWLIAALLAAAVLAVAGLTWTRGRTPVAAFVEHRMSDPHDAPIAIAAARDGTIWFTIDRADVIGRIHNGQVERLATQGRNIEPLGLAIGADGSAWFTDIATRSVARVDSSGEVERFALDTPIVRLGRMAMAPDGAAWFAESTASSVTRLKDGKFTRHAIDTRRGGPYGVAVAADGTVWATLQGGNQLLRILPEGADATIDVPRPGVVPTDIAVGNDGSVWFLQFRANRIGRFKDGTFSDFVVAKENAGLTGLAVAADGAVWFGMVRGSSLGRLRDGNIDVFRLPRDDARPYSVAVDPDGNVWYADIRGYVGMLRNRYARR